MSSRNKLFIIYNLFFLIYFIVAFPLSWLLLKFPIKICSEWLVYNNITENLNNCLDLDIDKSYPMLKIFFLWFFVYLISLKLFFTTKLYFFEKLLNTSINLISKIELKKKFFQILIFLILFFSFFQNFISFDRFDFLLLGISFINFFLIFYFLHLKKNILHFVSSLPLFVPLFYGEISKIIYLIIGLNFYHAVANKNSFFKILKYCLYFFILIIFLITSNKYFIKSYGYSSINRYSVIFDPTEKYFFKIKKKTITIIPCQKLILMMNIFLEIYMKIRFCFHLYFQKMIF